MRLVYDKRILFGDFSTLAYGTRSAIRFGDVEKEFGFLSNMFPCDVVYEGKKINWAEALFQWQKIPDVKNLQTMAARNEIQYAKTPFLSFAAGRDRLNVRKGWAEVRDNVMKEAIWLKFSQKRGPEEILLETGDRELISTDIHTY